MRKECGDVDVCARSCGCSGLLNYLSGVVVQGSFRDRGASGDEVVVVHWGEGIVVK